MTIEGIECFLLLAGCLNFTQAAEKAHISQTAMSRRISGLENELGAALFDRDNHHVELTRAGREFQKSAPALLAMYRNSVVQVQNAASGHQKELCIGIGFYEQFILSPFLDEYAPRNPELDIACLQFNYKELLEKFDQDLMNVILTSDQFITLEPQDQYDRVLLSEGEWRLCLHRSNPLAHQGPVEASQLGEQTLITMSTGSTNAIRSYYQRYFDLKNTNSVNSNDTKLALVNANLGVGLIPAFVNTGLYPNVVTRRLKPPYRPRRFYAVCKKEDQSPAVRQFIEQLRLFCRAHEF